MAAASVAGPPGPVALTVRLPRPSQRIFDVQEVMPVRPGPLTLYYPQWLPGDHAPDGPIGDMMGLEITAGGKRIAWHRDEVDMFTFRLTVPAGVDRIDVRFQFPADDRITPQLMGLAWNAVALYYAGYPTRTEIYQPTLVIPADWGYASALRTAKRSGGRITFKPVPFNTLVDSPVIAGKYFREIDVTPPASPVH
ncbi:MAG TPA: peptidase M61, partial [Acetobacteraceae bacterium]